VSSAAPQATTTAVDPLRPFVARIAVDWLRSSPEQRTRAYEGTMVFADVSGFTELTERLSRRGRAGSEEIATVLDAAFAELVAAAYAYDADLLKWGGDALLLLFRGDGHAERATAAATRMQQALEQMRRLRTSVGPVRLQVSIGAHSGTFQLFLVGDVHRELVVAGADATATVRTEGIADAGEIALSQATAALLDPALLGAPKDETILLAGEPRLPPIVPPYFDPSGVDLARLLPSEYTHELRGEPPDPELRHVAIAFVELLGTDQLLESEGPAALADALDERIGAIQQTCLRFGVTFAQTDISSNAVKVILLTGAPRSAGGDEEELLLRAGRAIVERPGRLPVRVGVNAGRVFAGIVGPASRRTYTFYGDATNTAARIMARAPEGGLLARREILDRVRTSYALEAVEPFAAKGKAELVHAVDVGEAVGQREHAAEGPFVGREAELGLLLEALGHAREGTGGLVVVRGDAGLGKSRLLSELRSWIVGLRNVGVQCEQMDSDRPYSAVGTVLARALQLGAHASTAELEARLRHAIALRAPALEPWLPLLGLPLGLELPPTPQTARLEERFLPERIAETVEAFLRALVPDTAIVVIDDAHWLDEASNDLIGRIARDLDTLPWLILVARRDRPGGFRIPEGVEAIEVPLEPLTPELSRELVDRLTEGAPLPRHVVEGVAERSGGSPLFLTELVGAVRAGGDLAALPGSVEALMAAQIDELPPADRSILRHAAVVGGRFELETLLHTLGLDAPEGASVLLRLEDYLVVDDEGIVRFRHGLLREAAYEGLPFRRRRDLHERVGTALEREAGEQADAIAGVLSHHFYEAADWERARRYGWLAGRHAKDVYANVDAAVQLERSLSAARRQRKLPPEEVTRIAEALGDVRVALGEFEPALDAFQVARRRLDGDAVEEARLLHKESYVPYRLGRYPEAQRRLERGLELLEPVHSVPAMATRARIEARRAAVEQAQGRLRETIAWAERAIEDAEVGEAKDALAHGLNVLDSAFVALGQPDRATHGRRALQLFDELGELSQKAGLLNNLGILAYYAGNWDEALESYRDAHDAWEQAGDRWAASFAASNIAEVLSSQGRLEDAEPLLRDVLRVSQAAGTRSRVATALAELGKLEARRGEIAEALGRLRDARAIFAELGEDGGTFDVDGRIAEALVLGGDAERASALALSTLPRAEGSDAGSLAVPVLLRALGLAHLLAGRLEPGCDALRRSVAAAEAVGSNYDVAVALDALVHAERLAGAEDGVAARRDQLFDRLGIVSTPLPRISS
jgi:class 3 adenylate cyclase/tetratricopeptide (TPR) repeat protein